MSKPPLNCSVLVPYRPDNGWRTLAWEAIRPRWEALGVELLTDEGGPGESPAEFNHPAAINRCAERATRDVLIMADADCGWTPGLPERLVAAIRHGAAWSLPLDYAKLTKPQTERVYRYHSEPSLHDLAECEWVGRGVSWSGLVCFTWDGWSTVGGWDERYEWWGSDDIAFGLSMNDLVGPVERVIGAAVHHWHPTPIEHSYGHPRHREQEALSERYRQAAGDPDAIAQVRFGT